MKKVEITSGMRSTAGKLFLKDEKIESVNFYPQPAPGEMVRIYRDGTEKIDPYDKRFSQGEGIFWVACSDRGVVLAHNEITYDYTEEDFQNFLERLVASGGYEDRCARGDTIRIYRHIVKGTLSTELGWCAWYDQDALEARGLTLSEAFEADVGVVFLEV